MPSRIETLQKKLKAREGQSGFEKNCQAIRQEIARLTTIPSKQNAPAVASGTDKD
jgi:hypothetical protein